MLTIKRYITSDGKYPNFENTWDKAGDVENLNASATRLIAKVSTLLSMAGMNEVEITSGWRPAAHNFAVGGSATSKHITAQAIDILDPDKKLGEWCMINQPILNELGLYMESLQTTHAAANRLKRWVHAQTVAPLSGKTVFIP